VIFKLDNNQDFNQELERKKERKIIPVNSLTWARKKFIRK